jgi:hypothetical protein
VDELHSAENKANKTRQFLLTSKMTGVKTNSFFDSFRGFLVGGESGAEASSPQPRLQRIGKRRDSDGQ